jgi:NADH:ubiquinone oxidoreductase subunit 5 (subunit L)/multisubunit Na+/H+ antiporter MnhA subunit
MRPEYIEAIDAVRWGWSLRICFAVPTLIIWLGFLFSNPTSSKRQIVIQLGVFLVACLSQWALIVFHANHIQSTKYHWMQTPEEEADWSSDTWRVFAPITSIPFVIVYCTANLVAAGSLRATWSWFARRRLLLQENRPEHLPSSDAHS